MNLKNISNLIFLILLGVMQASCAQEAWQQVLAEIDQQDYAAARTTLEGMQDKGYGPWYLLGTLYEKQKEMPRALVAYRHAQKNAAFFHLTKIMPAIERVGSQLGNSINSAFEYMKTMLFITWPLIFQLMFLISWFFLLYALRRKKGGFLILLVLLMNLIFGILCFAQWHLLRQRFAVVMEEVPVRIGPSPSYQQREQLKPGAEVLLSGQSKDALWYKIKRGNVLGWIPAQAIEQI